MKRYFSHFDFMVFLLLFFLFRSVSRSPPLSLCLSSLLNGLWCALAFCPFARHSQIYWIKLVNSFVLCSLMLVATVAVQFIRITGPIVGTIDVYSLLNVDRDPIQKLLISSISMPCTRFTY